MDTERRGAMGRWMALALLSASWAIVPEAAAHDPPFVTSMVEMDETTALMTNRGLMLRYGGDGPWHLLCSEAFGANSVESADFTLTPDGTIVVASSTGLHTSTDGGCSFEVVPGFEGTWASALATLPGDPLHMFVATYAQGGGSGIFESSDGAATWSMRGTIADDEAYAQILVPPSWPDWFYAAGQTIVAPRVFFTAVSPDRGASWTRYDVDLADTEVDYSILAVHPADPETFLARTFDPTLKVDRLLMTSDGGQTFRSPLSIERLAAAAFSPDASVIVVAGILGLWRSIDGGATFTQLPGPERISHVQYRGGDLIAGGFYQGLAARKDGLGISSDHGDTFRTFMDFNDVTEPAPCEASSSTAVLCEFAWLDWMHEYGPLVAPEQDAGTPDGGKAMPDAGADARVPDEDAGTGRDAPSAATPADGCRCAAVGAAPSALSPAALPWLLVASAWRLRTRRRRTQRRSRP